MKKMILVLLFITIQAQAGIWAATRDWTESDEAAYSEFITTQVGPDFFKALGTPFSELKLDCADAAYALKIYFAKINGLSFKISGRKISNEDIRFDYIKDENKKLAAFIFDVVDNNGTENLSESDSYPIKIQDIRGGDLFMYKIESAPGTFSRHTYLIKNVNSNGTFDVLYSTQARRDAGMPMNRIKQYSFANPRWVPNHTSSGDRNTWGFKRMRLPQQRGISLDKIPNASFEQYDLANQLGDQFFEYVKNQRTTIKETASQALNRNIEFLCHELNDRVEVVSLAQTIRANTNNACMDPVTFDTYSTPSRDGGILGTYNKIFSLSDGYKRTGEWVSVDAKIRSVIEGIFNPQRTDAVNLQIKNSCNFQNRQGLNTNLALFYEALLQGRASSHPNDSLFNRWGILGAATAPLTSCPRY